MVRNLKEKDARQLVDRRTFARIRGARAGRPFGTIEEVWRRASVSIGTLQAIAQADGFCSLGLSRREVAWALKGLRDNALPLFAAADDRDNLLRPEAIEPAVTLPRMTQGREVVEDYHSTGLTLRAHPLSFLRTALSEQGFEPCSTLTTAKNGQRISIAGLVLVRQMPGSAKGVMFITLEDEGANANLIVWPSVFDANRRTILGATMLGVRGRVQREGDVIHLIVEYLRDMSADLKAVSGLDVPFPLVAGRGDEAKHGGHGADSRAPKTLTLQPRDIYIPDLHIDTLKVKARNFR